MNNDPYKTESILPNAPKWKSLHDAHPHQMMLKKQEKERLEKKRREEYEKNLFAQQFIDDVYVKFSLKLDFNKETYTFTTTESDIKFYINGNCIELIGLDYYSCKKEYGEYGHEHYIECERYDLTVYTSGRQFTKLMHDIVGVPYIKPKVDIKPPEFEWQDCCVYGCLVVIPLFFGVFKMF